MDTVPVVASLVLVAIATLPGLALIRKGQHERDWHLVVSRRNTQTRRYAFVMIGQAIIIASLTWLISINTADDVLNAVGLCFTKGPFGWLLGILVLLACASPIITVIALLNILRHPCEMAHKGPMKNSYCFTLYHRKGECKFVAITVDFDPRTGTGVQHRTEL